LAGAGHAGRGAVGEAPDALQGPVEIAAGAAAGGLFEQSQARPSRRLVVGKS